MNKKIVSTALSMLFIIGLTGCKKQEQINPEQQLDAKEETKLDFNISEGYVELEGEDLEVVEWSYSAKDPDNQDKNGANLMGDVIVGGIDNMSKKAVNINLRQGQSLRIETDIDYPITVMLKDNSNEKYIFNKTSSPVDNAILVDEVSKDGRYELMVDFNEIDEFTFKVYIVK